MGASEAADMVRQALMLVLLVGAPVLVVGLLVGTIIAVLQAMTQVQEQTLTLVPKILAMLLALVIVGPWMIQRLVEFGREMFVLN